MAEPKGKKAKLSADQYDYLEGYGNLHLSEAIEGSVPRQQNTPQKCAKGLYAEQLNGTSFTTPRRDNQRSWMYRILPSVADHSQWERIQDDKYKLFTLPWVHSTPEQLRWMPLDEPKEPDSVDFLQGMVCWGGTGDAAMRAGFALFLYTANKNMEQSSFCSSDGDWLIVPWQGTHDIQTEFGKMLVQPGEICIIPRGIRFAVRKQGGEDLKGYVCELFDGHFTIPDLGPIGTTGLTDPRHFQVPVAAYDVSTDSQFTCYQKFNHTLWKYTRKATVFDVVGWHGNYYPSKYDLSKFCVINTVSWDHIDPSIFTVLTCQTLHPGVAAIDFVIFPPRWSVAENTFKPPFYHRNCMTEYMGLIKGQYEAKKAGFVPGGGSLHSLMAAHGPETAVYRAASTAKLQPERVAENSLAFMFESHYMLKLTDFSLNNKRDEGYITSAWKDFDVEFKDGK